MKAQKFLLRVWLALTSLALFAGGWIALAHSPKPVQSKVSEVPAMPSLPPIPSVEELSTGQNFSAPFVMPAPRARLRTGGS